MLSSNRAGALLSRIGPPRGIVPGDRAVALRERGAADAGKPPRARLGRAAMARYAMPRLACQLRARQSGRAPGLRGQGADAEEPDQLHQLLGDLSNVPRFRSAAVREGGVFLGHTIKMADG